MKLWGGRFQGDTSTSVEDFTASISFDQRLAPYDIEGSIAHTKMLVKQNLITKGEGEAILEGLSSIKEELERGTFTFTNRLEDIHLHIEEALIQKIGAVGGKLHTGRSRNDQIALDMRLYVKEETRIIQGQLLHLLEELLSISQRYMHIILPGYTHLQRAQPIRLSHYYLAYYQMFKRDLGRLLDTKKRLMVMPLGSGALAGSSLPLDREYVAKELGFKRISQNSLDAISDRDFILEFLSFAAITGQHISRLAEDVILWSTAEFAFIEMSDGYCTGSSMMPQKKNPDVAELLRGKTGRLYGNLFCLLTVMKGLPLSYNRDLQEDKEALFDTIDTLKGVLQLTTGLLKELTIKGERMKEACRQGYLQATDVADYLVKKGLPFRKSHMLVGRIVLYALKNDKQLQDLSLEEWKSFSHLFAEDINEELHLEKGLDKRDLIGGVALRENLRQLEEAWEEIKRFKKDFLLED